MAKAQTVKLDELLSTPAVEKAEETPKQKVKQFPSIPTGEATETVLEWLDKKNRSSQLYTEMKEEEAKVVIPLIQKHGVHTKPEAPESAIAMVNDYKCTVVVKPNWYYTEAPGIALLKLAKEYSEAKKNSPERQGLWDKARQLMAKIEGGGFEKDAKAPAKGYKLKMADLDLQKFLEEAAKLEDQLVVTKEDLDWDAWKVLFDTNRIPDELVAAVSHQGDPSMYVLVKESNEKACAKCEEAVSKNDKFCKNCGAKQ